MTREIWSAVGVLWGCFFIYWFVAAGDVKTTLRHETYFKRSVHVVPLVAAAVLFFSPHILPQLLTRRVWPPGDAIALIGLAVVALGLGFAVWARRHLGRNWSGMITLKEDHTLIRSGPYAVVRHPIYSGMLAAFLGSAVALGEWRGLVAVALALLAFLMRARAEDGLMARTFGEEYADYRRRTKALIPFVI